MLRWNVYYQNFNQKDIVVFNIFNHSTFRKKVEELSVNSKEEFSKELNSLAMYYFWSKCEYEVVITSWPPYISKDEYNRLKDEAAESNHKLNINPEVGIKIDIYDQLKMNWDRFVDYIWKYKEE